MGRALRLLDKARERAAVAFGSAVHTFKDAWGRYHGNQGQIRMRLQDPWKHPGSAVGDLPGGGSVLGIFRRRAKSGTVEAERFVHLGKNQVYAFITRKDGTIDKFQGGLSENLLTNIGCMVLIGQLGADKAAGNTVASDVSTAIGASSVTGTGSVWTASNLATPTLGVAGWRVYMNAHVTTNPTVYGNVISNTTNVLTIDQWWKADDTLGTTPTSGDAFIVGAGGIASPRFMAVSTDSGAALATHTTLTSETNVSNVSRTRATFARGSNPSGGSGSFTLQVVWSPSGTITAIHKMGLFFDGTAVSAGPMCFETVLNADATVASGDTLTVTDTITLSG